MDVSLNNKVEEEKHRAKGMGKGNPKVLRIFDLYLIFLSYQVTVTCHGHRSRPVTWYVTWLLTHPWHQRLRIHLRMKFYSIPLHSIHFYSILFTSILFYSIPFKFNTYLCGITRYSYGSRAVVARSSTSRVYKGPSIVDNSLTLTINITSP
jgi:hypothetical protein